MKFSLIVVITSVFISLLLRVPAVAQVHDPRALTANPDTAAGAIAPVLKGLGNHHFAVTTGKPESQYFFNQGYRLTLGFNHSEALRSFKESARLDPQNAMAYWGMSLALGPNLNLPMQASVAPKAYAAIQKAVALKASVSAREQGYIDAMATRYSLDPNVERSLLDAAYAVAMAALVKKYPDDLDAATLYAAAVMNTNPWDYWYPDGSPKPHTEKIMATLQSVIQRNPKHAGAHHYLIHTVEAFRPELGVASADILGGLMPGAGHLLHMPSHIYMRVGRYEDSRKANLLAVQADEGYITQCRAQGLYPLAYYPHNLHFLAWSAMFQGRSQEALNAGKKVAQRIAANGGENTWGLNETFMSQPLFIMVRFAQWAEILAQPQPNEKSRFRRGIWHYGRGMAYVHTGKTKLASKELNKLLQLRKLVEKDEAYYVGFGAAAALLSIAEEVLSGELAAKQKDFHNAITHLERAVRLEDGLPYNEPPDWYFPVRHFLGAVLLEAKLPAEAEVVYWEDLRNNPANGFSLFGLQQALKAQGKTELLAVIEKRFEQAWAHADVVLSSSRY